MFVLAFFSCCRFSQCITENIYLALPFQFKIVSETSVKVSKDSVAISGLQQLLPPYGSCGPKGQTVHLTDADPNNLQDFMEHLMLDNVKGKSVE